MRSGRAVSKYIREKNKYYWMSFETRAVSKYIREKNKYYWMSFETGRDHQRVSKISWITENEIQGRNGATITISIISLWIKCKKVVKNDKKYK